MYYKFTKLRRKNVKNDFLSKFRTSKESQTDVLFLGLICNSQMYKQKYNEGFLPIVSISLSYLWNMLGLLRLEEHECSKNTFTLFFFFNFRIHLLLRTFCFKILSLSRENHDHVFLCSHQLICLYMVFAYGKQEKK